MACFMSQKKSVEMFALFDVENSREKEWEGQHLLQNSKKSKKEGPKHMRVPEWSCREEATGNIELSFPRVSTVSRAQPLQEGSCQREVMVTADIDKVRLKFADCFQLVFLYLSFQATSVARGQVAKHLAESKLKVTDVLRAKICNELHRKAVTLA